MVDDPEKMVKRRSTRACKRNIKLKDYGQWGNRGVVAIEGSWSSWSLSVWFNYRVIMFLYLQICYWICSFNTNYTLSLFHLPCVTTEFNDPSVWMDKYAWEWHSKSLISNLDLNPSIAIIIFFLIQISTALHAHVHLPSHIMQVFNSYVPKR